MDSNEVKVMIASYLFEMGDITNVHGVVVVEPSKEELGPISRRLGLLASNLLTHTLPLGIVPVGLATGEVGKWHIQPEYLGWEIDSEDLVLAYAIGTGSAYYAEGGEIRLTTPKDLLTLMPPHFTGQEDEPLKEATYCYYARDVAKYPDIVPRIVRARGEGLKDNILVAMYNTDGVPKAVPATEGTSPYDKVKPVESFTDENANRILLGSEYFARKIMLKVARDESEDKE